MQLTITFAFELISLITVIFFAIKKRDKLLKFFVPFLFITVVVEFTGWWLTIHNGSWKFALYNVFTALEFIFYAILFFTYLNRPALKKVIRWFFPLFIAGFFINILFIQGLNKTFNNYIFLLGSFCILVFCCFYFYESIQSEKIEEQLSKQPFFWVTSGLLINYLGSVIINALFEYLTTNNLQFEGRNIYIIINNTLNVILYSSFCIAFYLCPDSSKTYS